MPEIKPGYDEQGRPRWWVLDKDTGHSYPELVSVVNGNPDAYEVLDEPAVDNVGRLRPPVFAGQSAAPEGYESNTVAELKEEIARRNVDRDDDNQIPAQGNKPDLIAALEADDNKE